MSYKSYLSFVLEGEDGQPGTHKNMDLPLLMFQVDGGTSRMIDLRKTDDFSLGNELEQVRTYKNIILYLATNSGHRDVKAALDLTDLAQKGNYFYLLITFQKFSGKKMVEGFALQELEALVKIPPQVTPQKMTNLWIELSEPDLFRGLFKKHERVRSKRI